ncbi:hypothetical protein ABTL53_19380, partial [Acinetobacter baumannii]
AWMLWHGAKEGFKGAKSKLGEIMGDPNLANLRDTIKMGLSGVPWADALDGDVATRAVRQAFRNPGQAINMVLDNFRAKRAEAGVTSDAAV